LKAGTIRGEASNGMLLSERELGLSDAHEGIVDLPVIHFSVDWWRSLHQRASVSTFDVKLEGLMLFTLFLALVAFGVLYLWLLVHRFRGLWLEDEAEASGLDLAIAERRAEATADAEVRA
jgi:heme exporter protein C